MSHFWFCLFTFCRLSELRQQKQKLSRQVRDKEEELENSLQKIDSLRQDIRKAEKIRGQLELRSEESVTEALKGKIRVVYDRVRKRKIYFEIPCLSAD